MKRTVVLLAVLALLMAVFPVAAQAAAPEVAGKSALLMDVADGKATKIIIPSQMQGLVGLANGLVEGTKE